MFLQEVFRQMKAFFDLANKLQYFPSLPSLPLVRAFLLSPWCSDETIQTPPTFHAIEVITILNQVDEMFLSEGMIFI